MGTHPIFESDFDCLTEHVSNMSTSKTFHTETDEEPRIGGEIGTIEIG